MPKVNLRQSFVENPPLPKNKSKVDYFDTQLIGFLLEVTKTGRASFYLRYRDTSQRLRQVRIGQAESMSLEEARERARTLKNKVLMGFDVLEHKEKIKQVPTFREFTQNKYIPHAQAYKRSWEYDKSMIDKKMLGIWGRKKMNEFKPGDLLEFQSNLVRQNFKPASVNRVMALVKHIFNLAERWELIDRAPTRNVSKLADNGARERYLSPDELSRLLKELDNCKSQVVPDIIKLLILTGARKTEVVELPWAELDFEEGTWTLPAERNKGKREKTIPLSDAALTLLKGHMGNGSEYVFPNPATGEPMKHFHGTWDRIRRNAGVPDLRVHDIRHSFASMLINSGHSLYEIQKLLGHADLSTTQRYSHLMKSTLKNAAQTVSKLFQEVG